MSCGKYIIKVFLYYGLEHKILHSPHKPTNNRKRRTRMTETAVSLAGQHALPKFLEVIQMLRGLEKEVEDTKDEPDSFSRFHQ